MKRNQPWNWAAWIGVMGLLVLLIGLAYVFLAGTAFGSGFSYLERATARSAVVGLFVLGAILRYILRKSAGQFFYGVAQLAFGLVAAWLSLEVAAMRASPTAPDGVPTNLALIAALGGALYLICHGIENLAEGIRQPFGESPPKTGGAQSG